MPTTPRHPATIRKPRGEARPQISQEAVCRVVLKARQFGAKEATGDVDAGSSAVDDGFRGVLSSSREDPVYEELRTFIDGLDIDDQCELVALMWIGRGDFAPGDWQEALDLAQQEHTEKTSSSYLLQTPLLPDYLSEGLSQFGMSCEEFEMFHP